MYKKQVRSEIVVQQNNAIYENGVA